jgi:integrase
MKKEKNIYERDSVKKGKYLQVKIRFKDPESEEFVSKEFGRFYICDYKTPGEAMKQAVKCRNRAQEEIERGEVARQNMIFTVLDCYEKTKELLLRSQKNKDRHDKTFRNLIDSALAKKDILKVTAADVQKSLNEYARDHSDGCVADAMTVWRQIYQVAFMMELPVRDMSRVVTVPKSKVPKQPRATSCTLEDIEAFLGVLPAYGLGNPRTRHRCMILDYAFRIMLYEGLRPQEVFALSREDIDLEGMTLHVRKSVGSSEDKYRQIIPTKTTESMAAVPIADDLKETLQELLDWSKSDPLLADHDGKPVEIQDMCTLVFNIRQKFNLPKVTMYMPRHIAATELYNSTDRKKDVQSIFRHKSGTMTQYYVNIDDNERRKLINSRKL